MTDAPDLIDLFRILLKKSPGSAGFLELKNEVRLKLGAVLNPRVVEADLLLAAHNTIQYEAAQLRAAGHVKPAMHREKVMADLVVALGYDPKAPAPVEPRIEN